MTGCAIATGCAIWACAIGTCVGGPTGTAFTTGVKMIPLASFFSCGKQTSARPYGHERRSAVRAGPEALGTGGVEVCAYLVLDLGAHAAGDTEGEQISDAVDDGSELLE